MSDPEAMTSTTIFMKCGVITSSEGRNVTW